MPARRVSLLPVAFLPLLFVGCARMNLAAVSRDSYVGSETCIACHRQRHGGLIAAWRAGTHRATLRTFDGQRAAGMIGRPGRRHVLLGGDLRIAPSPGWDEGDDEEPFEPPHDVIAVEPARVDAGRQCLGCHTTGYFVSQRLFAEPGVGCEACHGPGRRHARVKGSKGTIVNPARLSPSRSNMVCGQCHSHGRDRSGGYPFPTAAAGRLRGPFQPGSDLAELFADAKPKLVRKGWEYSLFAQADKRYSRQRCTRCHDAHGRIGKPAMLKDPTNEMCFRCHGLGRARLRYENHWGLGDATKKPCWDCHRNVHSH